VRAGCFVSSRFRPFTRFDASSLRPIVVRSYNSFHPGSNTEMMLAEFASLKIMRVRSGFVLLVLLCIPFSAPPVAAQPIADTLFTWKGYSKSGVCRVRLFQRSPRDKEKTHVVVVRELAENSGPSTVDDARYLVELIGRGFGIDPVKAYWIFHWGAFSFSGARQSRKKDLFLRATFRRGSTHRLSAPTWRVITREDVDQYTDRQFR